MFTKVEFNVRPRNAGLKLACIGWASSSFHCIVVVLAKYSYTRSQNFFLSALVQLIITNMRRFMDVTAPISTQWTDVGGVRRPPYKEDSFEFDALLITPGRPRRHSRVLSVTTLLAVGLVALSSQLQPWHAPNHSKPSSTKVKSELASRRSASSRTRGPGDLSHPGPYATTSVE
jgi:hypothetical protein